jgi:hypothetical protein
MSEAAAGACLIFEGAEKLFPDGLAGNENELAEFQRMAVDGVVVAPDARPPGGLSDAAQPLFYQNLKCWRRTQAAAPRCAWNGATPEISGYSEVCA